MLSHAYQAEPVERIETIDQEEVVCGSRSTRVAQYRSYRLTKETNRPAFKTREDESNKTVESGCSKGKKSLDRKKTRHIRPQQVVEFDRGDQLAKVYNQIHPSTDDNPSSLQGRNGILEDDSGLQGERLCGVQTPKKRT